MCWRLLLAMLLVLLGGNVWATAYTLPAATFPPCQGTWTQSSNSCSGSVVFAAGDTVTSSSALTIQSNGGFTLNGNVIGSAGAPISLSSSFGDIRSTGSAASAVSGSISAGSSGAINLTNVTVSGSINTSGIATFNNSTIDGNVTASNGINSTNSNFNGSLTATTGTINLQGGTINGTIKGDCCAITISGATVTGDINNSNNSITINNSTVTGNINNNHNVQLNGSTVNGNVNAASWAVITGTSGSKVNGTCTPTVTSPTDLCGPPVTAGIDHFEFIYASPALTCNPQPVTIRACSNADCSTLYTQSVTLALSPSSFWTATAPATVSGNNLTFSGGTAQLTLSIASEGTVSLGVGSATPSPNNALVCSTSGCQIAFAKSALLLQVPNMLAAKPTSASVSAVRASDNAKQCVPAFANVTRTVSFSSAYANPTSGTQAVVINGTAVGGSAVGLSLSFDANGSAPLTVRYDDAGQISLAAGYSGSVATGDPGLVMTGSDLFVSKPYGLCLRTDSTCSSADASCALFPGDVRAGDPFALRIQAVAWEADGEASSAAQLCTGNLITPNFRLADIALSSNVVAPADGVSGAMTPPSYSHALGNQTETSTAIQEVGVFTLTATPPSGGYLDGETVGGGTSDLVGRFIPAYLSAEGEASLTPSCAPTISYQGQPMGFASGHEPHLTLAGRSRSDLVTLNYDRGDFWKLADPGVGDYQSLTATRDAGLYPDATWPIELAERDARLQVQGSASLAVEGADDGDGSRTYRWSDQSLTYQRAATPGRADQPFLALIRQSFPATALTDADGACYGNGTGCSDYSYDFSDDPGSEVRLGQVLSQNIRVSVGNTGLVPTQLEHWFGSAWTAATDSCTTLDNQQLDYPDAGSSAGPKAATVDAASWDQIALPVMVTSPSAPQGSVWLRHELVDPTGLAATWLCQTRNEDEAPLGGVCSYLDVAGPAETRASATFGVFLGPSPLIYRREQYR